MRFEWDPTKAARNARKHGVTFEEASECFFDPLALFLEDSVHPDRAVLIGTSKSRRLVFAVYVETSVASIRIISARKVVSRERRLYEEGL